MKAVVMAQRGKLVYTDVPLPALKEGWALVEVKASAVCATDLELIYSDIVTPSFPHIPGHEWSGCVVKVASEKDNHWLGKRVVGSNDVACMECDACLSGNIRYCEFFQEIGFMLPGAYAEYLALPAKNLVELPSTLSFLQGALIEPLAVGVGCVTKGGVTLGNTVTVMGMGSIGLNVISAAKATGAHHIIAAASTLGRAGFAQKAGASILVETQKEDLISAVQSYHPKGSDIVIDTTGNADCIRQAVRLARLGGTIVLAGYGGGKSIDFPIDEVHLKNLTVRGAGKNWGYLQKCLAILQDGLSTEAMATHLFPLADYQQALALAKTRPEGFVKSVFVF